MRDRRFKASQWVPAYSLGEEVTYVRPGRDQTAIGTIVGIDVHHYWQNFTPHAAYTVAREGKYIRDHIGEGNILAARGEKGVQGG